MISWSLKTFKISDLKDYYKNPRILTQHQHEHLKASLVTFGMIDKPVVTPAGLIIGGHQRIRVLKEMGLKEIECYVPDRNLTEKEIEELNIRLNRNTGEWDFETLANKWDIEDLQSWGFTEEELGITKVMTGDLGEGADEALDKAKKKKRCPNCGHEF